jgi:acyl-CoA synthetase (AMP-forming)/AMP-acid ligase II
MTALLVHERLDDPIAHRNGAVITVAQYLADVTYCAGKLPDAHHVLLACQDRYAFAVGFGAAMLRRQISLLPSTHTEELIAKLAVTYPNTYCLTDEADCSIKLPQTNISEWLLQARPETELAVPHFPIEQVAALVFTSGSTGLPIAHKKTWAWLPAVAIPSLVRCLRSTCMGSNPRCSLPCKMHARSNRASRFTRRISSVLWLIHPAQERWSQRRFICALC